jgi:DNA-directed RNA polymerase beta' subunit
MRQRGGGRKPAGAVLPSLGRQLGAVANPMNARDAQTAVAVRRQFKSSQVIGKGHAIQLIGSLLSAEETSKQAVCDLSKMATDDACLEDIRMGAREYGETCPTCQCDYGVCKGHFAEMSIPRDAWFLHPFFVKDGIAAAILNLFCYACFEERYRQTPEGHLPMANILFDQTTIQSLSLQYRQVTGIERLKILAGKAIARPCSERHSPTVFKSTTDLTLKMVRKNSETEADVKSLFFHLSSISRFLSDHRLDNFVGFPGVQWENLVIQTIPVIPTRNRPSVIINGDKTESNFTTLYRKILDILKRLSLPANYNETSQSTLQKELRDAYFQYIKADGKATAKGRGGRAEVLKTLKIVMDGKGGLWHKNTMSSRVDNSGRTVIVGDNGIKPNEVRIPRYMAEKFRIKLVITAANKDKAAELLRQGIIKVVVRGGEGAKIKVTEIKDDNRELFKLQVGDVVYRRMVTGDITIINRQPTLHRWSMMAMKAVVRDDPGKEVNSIGMNTVYVSGYNADFDGDEVHVHVPSSIEARSEAAALMGVERAPISDQTSQNIFGLIQNSVWGAYEMSKKPMNMTREDWYACTRNIQNFEGPMDATKPDFDLSTKIAYIENNLPKIYARNGIKGLGIYNTASLMSLAFPDDFSFKRPADDAETIYIEKGILLSGTLTKSIVGAGRRSIIQTLFRSHGSTAIVIYAHVMQQVTASWMETQGRFTVSMVDFAPGPDLEEQMESFKDAQLRNVKEISQRNTVGVFNRDLLIAKLREGWLRVPERFSDVITKQIVGRLINEIVFVLFEVMHVERNLVTRGRSAVLFRPERVDFALQKAVNAVLPAAGGQAQKEVSLLDTLRAGARLGEQAQPNELLIQEFKAQLFADLAPLLKAFVEEEMTNPLDPEAVPARSVHEIATIEADTLDALEKIRGDGIKMLKKGTPEGGSLFSMITSGARGNEGNWVQSEFALGQQTVSGARLKEAISGGTRVLPFFLENDPDPGARGYARNSFFRGLTPTEYFAAAMPARQTQTDTAFKTGETGYMQKRLMAFCGDFTVQQDGTVRDAEGKIVTYAYGGHFFDPSRMVRIGDKFSFIDIEAVVQQIRAEEDAIEKIRRFWYSGF